MGFGEVYDYVAGKVDWFGAGLPGEGRAAELTRIGELVDADVPTCAMDDRVGQARDRLGSDDVCLVVNEAGVVLGLVEDEDLGGESQRPVAEVMQEGPSTLRPNVPAAVLAGQVGDGSFPWVVVTTPEGTLVGILRGADLEAWARDAGQDQVAALHEAHDHG
ncbi:MAG: CBS domain-containing protein [Actinomycetota bacterium]|nr:CBS domain-containing protein [Actinomycetota bacterium]